MSKLKNWVVGKVENPRTPLEFTHKEPEPEDYMVCIDVKEDNAYSSIEHLNLKSSEQTSFNTLEELFDSVKILPNTLEKIAVEKRIHYNILKNAYWPDRNFWVYVLNMKDSNKSIFFGNSVKSAFKHMSDAYNNHDFEGEDPKEVSNSKKFMETMETWTKS